MEKIINSNDLFVLKEDRFKQTKTYQTSSILDPRWYLIESLSTKEISYINKIDSKEINHKPQPFIILVDGTRIELQGKVIKQEHHIGTETVIDGYDHVENVVPVVDYDGNIERYRTKYDTIERSHQEQYDYMAYTISYTVSEIELKKIAVASTIECLLCDQELSAKACKEIQNGALVICGILDPNAFEKKIEDLVNSINKKNIEDAKNREEAKAKKQQLQSQKAELSEEYKNVGNLQVFSFLMIFVCIIGALLTWILKDIHNDVGNSGFGNYPNADVYNILFILGIPAFLGVIALCFKLKSNIEKKSKQLESRY